MIVAFRSAKVALDWAFFTLLSRSERRLSLIAYSFNSALKSSLQFLSLEPLQLARIAASQMRLDKLP